MRPAHLLLIALAVGTVTEGCALVRANYRLAPDTRVTVTPEKVARGEYLAKNQMACTICHSTLIPGTIAAEPGKLAAGGRKFGREIGLPGVIYSTNLTPDGETGLGAWTDGEIIRAIREGVSRDGTALFPLMPYPSYSAMSDEDAEAIVAYLRSLEPVRNPIPKRELDFPVSVIVNTIPKPIDGAVAAPDPADKVKRGAYLAAMASCSECHTPMGATGPDMSLYMAGGTPFKEPDTRPEGLSIPNITQDKEQGLGNWTDRQIEDALRFGRRPDGRMLNPHMPWAAYNGWTEADMNALIAFLRTVPALTNASAKAE